MKKQILIIASFSLFGTFFLSSCFGNKSYEKKVNAEHKEKVENKLDNAGSQMNDTDISKKDSLKIANDKTKEKEKLEEAKENVKKAAEDLKKALKNGKDDVIKDAKEAKQKADDKLHELRENMNNEYN